MVTNKKIVEGYILNRGRSSIDNPTVLTLTRLLQATNIKEDVRNYCRDVHALGLDDRRVKIISNEIIKNIKMITQQKRRSLELTYPIWIQDSIPVKCDWNTINKVILAKELGYKIELD